ncbi:hypothetical protein K503DRAFT_772845 [Rhizopogon vinicolor AM-OR11-026]|uniref:Uncharacterized protein n=1 Tax=Rhizopogon vinicolor AM-OR11-026 TaxID=1314800 RepID=A0A1B7MTZ0_9AGAM|nr:hypothetical protein K503DRAFT_772845 [Rhizopogon vinicolor AM-OR11-026]
MTRSQHFFMIATRIDARAMQITGDIKFHLFMDMRAEFAWISFKMTPKQWALATETYNTRLEEKNHATGLETVKENPQAPPRKPGDIEVAVMNLVVKNDFKSRSGSETFWRRHCASSFQPSSPISTTTFLTPLSLRFTRPTRVPAARQSCTPV